MTNILARLAFLALIFASFFNSASAIEPVFDTIDVGTGSVYSLNFIASDWVSWYPVTDLVLSGDTCPNRSQEYDDPLPTGFYSIEFLPWVAWYHSCTLDWVLDDWLNLYPFSYTFEWLTPKPLSYSIDYDRSTLTRTGSYIATIYMTRPVTYSGSYIHLSWATIDNFEYSSSFDSSTLRIFYTLTGSTSSGSYSIDFLSWSISSLWVVQNSPPSIVWSYKIPDPIGWSLALYDQSWSLVDPVTPDQAILDIRTLLLFCFTLWLIFLLVWLFSR